MTDTTTAPASSGGSAWSTSSGLRFEDFYRQHRQRALQYARNLGAGDVELVADVALVDTFQALDRMSSTAPASVRLYLYRVVRTQVAREWRRHGAEVAAALDDEIVAVDPGFEDWFADELDLAQILAELPPDQRDVLQLRLVDDLSAVEAAEVLGKSATAVRQLQHRALRRLRRGLFAAALAGLAAIAALVFLVDPGQRPIDTDPVGRPAFDTPSERTGGPSSTRPGPGDQVGQDDSAVGPVATTTVDGSAEPIGPTTNVIPSSTPPVETTAGQPTTTIPATSAVPSTGGVSPTVITTVPTPSHGVLVYEPFNAGSAVGFVGDGSWHLVTGAATTSHDPIGLAYADAAGRGLATEPGALRIDSVDERLAQLGRWVTDGLVPDHGYWVSYLVRVESETWGDAFWTPAGWLDRGAVGVQQADHLRFVNGPVTPTSIVPGRTHLVVARLMPDRASVWIDPDLVDPGPAHADYTNYPIDAFGGRIRFSFNAIGDGAYTIDEVRLGTDYASVTPTG